MPPGYGGQGAPSQGSGPMNPGQGPAPGIGPSPPNFTSTSDAPGYPSYWNDQYQKWEESKW